MTKRTIDIDMITPGFDVRTLNQFDYMEVVYGTPLNKMGKYLLAYYAFRYNFKKGWGAYAGVKRTARDLGISTNTVNTWKKYLVEHKWIESKKRGNRETDVIYVSIGYPDPTISVPEYLSDERENWNEFLKDNRIFTPTGNAFDELIDTSIEETDLNDDDFSTNEEINELSIAV